MRNMEGFRLITRSGPEESGVRGCYLLPLVWMYTNLQVIRSRGMEGVTFVLAIIWRGSWLAKIC